MFNNANQHINVYGDDIEVDYRGYEVHKLIIVIILISVPVIYKPVRSFKKKLSIC